MFRQEIEEAEKLGFLDLPVTKRNEAVDLFANIKTELGRDFTLKELGFNTRSWSNVGLDDFLRGRKEYYLRIVVGSSNTKVSKKGLRRKINALYKIFYRKKPWRKGSGSKR